MFEIRRYKYDWLVSLAIVGIVAAVYATAVFSQTTRLKEEALIFELQSLRISVAAFHYMNGRNPADMNELADAGFIAKNGMRRMFVPRRIVERNFKDPFGSSYLYDASNGWIKTPGERYGGW